MHLKYTQLLYIISVATANIITKSFLLTEIKLKLDGKNINLTKKKMLKCFPGNFYSLWIKIKVFI